jgi:hypothetical protein
MNWVSTKAYLNIIPLGSNYWNSKEHIGRDLLRRTMNGMKYYKGMFRPWNQTKKEIE